MALLGHTGEPFHVRKARGKVWAEVAEKLRPRRVGETKYKTNLCNTKIWSAWLVYVNIPEIWEGRGGRKLRRRTASPVLIYKRHVEPALPLSLLSVAIRGSRNDRVGKVLKEIAIAVVRIFVPELEAMPRTDGVDRQPIIAGGIGDLVIGGTGE